MSTSSATTLSDDRYWDTQPSDAELAHHRGDPEPEINRTPSRTVEMVMTTESVLCTVNDQRFFVRFRKRDMTTRDLTGNARLEQRSASAVTVFDEEIEEVRAFCPDRVIEIIVGHTRYVPMVESATTRS